MATTRRLLTLTLVCLLSPCWPGQEALPNSRAFFSDPTATGDAPAAIAVEFSRFVAAAQKSVRFAMLRLDLPEVVSALVQAHKAGVDVRVVTDDDAKNGLYRSYYGQLVDAGITVETDRGTVFNVNVHNKFCVVDDTWVWTGDWNASHADTYLTWHAACLVKSPGLARDYAAQFDKLFDGERQGFEGRYERPRPTHPVVGGGRARVHFGFEEVLGDVVVRELASAKQRIELAHSVFHDQRVAMAVLAAWRRGVQVRVLYTTASGRLVASMARFGVPIRRLVSESLGAKFVLVDGRRLVTGSYNCTFDPDHENLIVLDEVGVLSEAYAARFELLWQRAAPYFLPAGHGHLAPDVHARDARAAGLAKTAASALPASDLSWSADSAAAPERTFGPAAPALEPVRVGWCSEDAGVRNKRYAVTLKRNGPVSQGDRWRVVMSFSELHDSRGALLTPKMRPLVFDDAALRNMDVEVEFPWVVLLPEIEGLYRVDLDVFQGRGDDGWRWIANYRVPPRLVAVTSGQTVDRMEDLTIAQRVPVGADWEMHQNCKVQGGVIEGTGEWGTVRSPVLNFHTSQCTHVWFRLTSRGQQAIVLVWIGWDGVEHKRTVMVIPDGEAHTYAIDLSTDPAWAKARRVRRFHVILGREAPLVALQELGTARR